MSKSNHYVISTRDTRELIEIALYLCYPQIQFKVKSKGAVIYISWNDGPGQKEVGTLTSIYKEHGKDYFFDVDRIILCRELSKGAKATIRKKFVDLQGKPYHANTDYGPPGCPIYGHEIFYTLAAETNF